MNHWFKIAGVLLSRFFGSDHETNRESSNNPNYEDAGGSEQSKLSNSSDSEAQMTQKSSEFMEEEDQVPMPDSSPIASNENPADDGSSDSEAQMTQKSSEFMEEEDQVLMPDSAPTASNEYPAGDEYRHGFDRTSLFSSSSADSGSSRLTGASLLLEVDNLDTSPIIELSKLSRFPFKDSSSYTKGVSSDSLSSASSSHVTTKEMVLPTHNTTDTHQTLNSVTVEIPPPPQHTEPSQIRSETLGDKDVAIKVLTIGCSMVVALLAFHKSTNMNLAMRLSMMSLLMGIVALLIGFFLHKEYPDFSDKNKLIGFAGIFIGLFGIVGAFLGFSFLSLFPALCAIAVVILLVFVFVKKL